MLIQFPDGIEAMKPAFAAVCGPSLLFFSALASFTSTTKSLIIGLPSVYRILCNLKRTVVH